mgnify:CR=1 FL=1
MAFLDRSSLIVDAVLTDKGREKLSSNSFEVTKFALGDDDIDYTLYDETNTNGPNFYGFAIESLPIMEAFTRSINALKYQLVTRPVDTNKIPSISNTIPDTFTLVGSGDYALISPSTLNMTEDTEDYIFTLVANENDLDFTLGDYGQSANKQAKEFDVNIMQLDTDGKGLAPDDILGYTVNGVSSKGKDPVSLKAPGGSVITIIPAHNKDKIITGVQLFGEGGIASKSGITKQLTNEETIYAPEGFTFIADGAVVLQMAIAVSANKAPGGDLPPLDPIDPENINLFGGDEEDKGGDKGGKDSGKGNNTILVANNGQSLTEAEQGVFRSLEQAGQKFNNTRIEIIYTSKKQQKSVQATILKLSADRTKLELKSKLSKAVPKTVAIRFI